MQKYLKPFIVCLLIFSTGFFAGIQLGSNRLAPSLASCQSELDLVKTKLTQLGEHDFEDYANTPEGDAKYQKANELLAKVLQLFITDIGLRLSQKSVDKIQQPIARIVPPPVNNPASSRPNATNEVAKPNLVQGQALTGWRSNEVRLQDIRDEGEIAANLEKVVIPDVMSEMNARSPVTPQQMEAINGHYEGWITFNDKREPWQIVWDVNGRVDANGKVTGTSVVALHKGGQIFSKTSGSGEIQNFSGVSGGSNALLVSVHAQNGVLQVYPASGLSKLVGNFYLRREAEKKYTWDGAVVMDKH